MLERWTHPRPARFEAKERIVRIHSVKAEGDTAIWAFLGILRVGIHF